jgi:hypothetical protein
MLILLLLISIAILVIGTIRYLKVGKLANDVFWDDFRPGQLLQILGVILIIVTLIATITVSIFVINGNIIQDRISLYETENAKIDSQICEIVEGYKTYEKETFENISNKSANVLVELYPDLKSNELVQKQMEIYMSNKNKVVSLQEDLINQKPLRWWLYFGG